MGIARWNGTEWNPLGEGVQGRGAGVYDLATDGQVLYVAGNFERAGPATATASPRGTDPRGPLCSPLTAQGPWYPLVTGVEVHGRDVYVAGSFDHAGATALAAVGRWDGTRWNPLGSGLAPNLYEGYWDTIRLEFFDGHLWVGGGFLAAGGEQSEHVACWSEPVVTIEVADFEALPRQMKCACGGG